MNKSISVERGLLYAFLRLLSNFTGPPQRQTKGGKSDWFFVDDNVYDIDTVVDRMSTELHLMYHTPGLHPDSRIQKPSKLRKNREELTYNKIYDELLNFGVLKRTTNNSTKKTIILSFLERINGKVFEKLCETFLPNLMFEYSFFNSPGEAKEFLNSLSEYDAKQIYSSVQFFKLFKSILIYYYKKDENIMSIEERENLFGKSLDRIGRGKPSPLDKPKDDNGKQIDKSITDRDNEVLQRLRKQK